MRKARMENFEEDKLLMFLTAIISYKNTNTKTNWKKIIIVIIE